MRHLISFASGDPTLGILALLIFLSVFVGIVWVTWRLTPEYRQEMKNQPFDEGTPD